MEKLRRILEVFMIRKNEFDWDQDSLQKAKQIIENKLGYDINEHTQLETIHKLKGLGFGFAHGIKNEHTLKNHAILKFGLDD